MAASRLSQMVLHGLATVLRRAGVAELDSKFGDRVDLLTAQTVAGAKTFSDAAAFSSTVGVTGRASLGPITQAVVAATGTLAITQALHDGKTILLDTAAGSVCTLPAPTIGMKVRFLVSVKPTTNFHQVKVAAATDFLAGSVNLLDADATAQTAYQADGTADDNIQLNGTTKGGQVGDWIEVEGITATQWAIRGQLICQAGSNIADPLSAAV